MGREITQGVSALPSGGSLVENHPHGNIDREIKTLEGAGATARLTS